MTEHQPPYDIIADIDAADAPPAATPCPFTIAIDSREQAPWRFTGIRADSSIAQSRPEIIVPTVTQCLATGDYSLLGHEHAIAVERKSLADLYGTLSQRREQFELEHERMAEIVSSGGVAVVVIEADWETIIHWPPEQSRLAPKTVLRTHLSWLSRYRVNWLAVPGRRFAEVYVFRLFEKFWKHRSKEEKEERTA